MKNTEDLKKWKKHAVMSQLGAVVTVKEAEELTGVPARTIQEACSKGWILARQSGKTWLMRKQDALDRWCRTTNPPQEQGAHEESASYPAESW